MRIAYLLADPGIGVFGTKGASVHVQEMVRAFRRLGHEVTVYAVRRGDRKGAESVPDDLQDLAVVIVPVAAAAGSAERELELQRAASAMARTAARDAAALPGGLDLVYERYSLFSQAGAELAELSGAPLVLEVNAPLVQEQRRHRSLHHEREAVELTERSLTAATLVSCVSEPVAAWVRRTAPAAAERTVVTPNGVNTERIRPAEDAERPARPFTVGFLGTLKPWHGTHTLLHAVAASSRAAGAGWRVEFCGTGPELPALQELARELGLTDQVRFHGAVAPRDVPAVLRGWDVATAPYPAPAAEDDHYFSPLKVYEYLAAGLAVVASAVGELPAVLGTDPDGPGAAADPAGLDDVRVGERGITVTPGDAAALARALDLLDADPALTAALGRAARADVEAHHTWDRRAEDLLAAVLPGGVPPVTAPSAGTEETA